MAAMDFDFLLGDWHVTHRRLQQRLVGSEDWAAFDGTMRARPILGGLGNFDENAIADPDGHCTASTLRLFDPATARWSIHWVDSRRMTLDPPMTGRFVDDVGTFYGDDQCDGQAVQSRFLWQHDGNAARWEQAFSIDAGASWETNWTMDFARA